MRWPYASWGADAVIAGHDHLYERLERDGIAYFVNGLGGREGGISPIHRFKWGLEGSKVRYNQEYGAMLVTADESCINFSFYNTSGLIIDSLTLNKPETLTDRYSRAHNLEESDERLTCDAGWRMARQRAGRVPNDSFV